MKYSNYFVSESKNEEKDNSLGKTFLGVTQDKSKKVILHQYPSSELSLGNEYFQYKNYDDTNGNLMNHHFITDSSSEECKQICINRGQDCKGFVYDKANNTCALKGQIYPNTKRIKDEAKDIYTRMPKIANNESCPKGVKAVSSEFLNKNGLISNEHMSMDFQCETEAGVMEVEQGLESAYNTLSKQVSSLKDENKNIMTGFEEVKKEVKNNIGDYNTTDSKIKALLKENPTVNKMMSDSEQLESVFSMRNSAYVLVLILLSIFLVRVLRK